MFNLTFNIKNTGSSTIVNINNCNTVRYSRIISIDTLIDIYGVPDVIKIDVEGGSEYSVIKSFRPNNLKNLPVICFTFTSDLLFSITYLESIGFNSWYIQNEENEECYNVNELYQQINKMVPKEYQCVIWCKHQPRSL
jgi:hypothetical protein